MTTPPGGRAGPDVGGRSAVPDVDALIGVPGARGCGTVACMPERTRGRAAVPDVDALMAQVAQGDRDAFGSLYDALAPLVHGLVLHSLHEPARGGELTEEVFLELWRQAPRLDAGPGGARAWAALLARRRSRGA